MNKVFLTGNLTKEPNISYTTSSDPLCVCKMTVAVNDDVIHNSQFSFPRTPIGVRILPCSFHSIKPCTPNGVRLLAERDSQ